MLQNLKPYKKEYDYSYTLGVFLTIELLENKPEQAICIVAGTDSARNGGLDKIREICDVRRIPFEVNDKIISRLSTKDNCYVIGFFRKFESLPEAGSNHIVLVNPMDSGNIGTIMRTGLGFGFRDLAIIRPAVDVYDPKSVRSSMGAVFSMRFRYFETFQDYAGFFPEHSLYPFLLSGKYSIHNVSELKNIPFSLIFGNESSGLPQEFENEGTGIVIPHSGSIDSLNLSIAAGIAMYEFSK